VERGKRVRIAVLQMSDAFARRKLRRPLLVLVSERKFDEGTRARSSEGRVQRFAFDLGSNAFSMVLIGVRLQVDIFWLSFQLSCSFLMLKVL